MHLTTFHCIFFSWWSYSQQTFESLSNNSNSKMFKAFVQSILGRVLSHFRNSEVDSCVTNSRQLVVHVTTGDKKRAGTDANVWLILYDENDLSTECIKLNRSLKNDNERGDTCTFFVDSGHGFGHPLKVSLHFASKSINCKLKESLVS